MKTELEKHEVLRMSNEQSNKLTKECLQTALVYLMNEKPFDKISITELVKRSGVSRTAFYRNYSSKEDILNEISDEIIKVMVDSLKDKKFIVNPYEWYYELFSEVKDNSALVTLLLKADMFYKVFDGVTSSFKKAEEKLSPEEQYYVDALVGAHSSIVLSWFRNGMTESVEFMAGLCSRIKNSIVMPK